MKKITLCLFLFTAVFAIAQEADLPPQEENNTEALRKKLEQMENAAEENQQALEALQEKLEAAEQKEELSNHLKEVHNETKEQLSELEEWEKDLKGGDEQGEDVETPLAEEIEMKEAALNHIQDIRNTCHKIIKITDPAQMQDIAKLRTELFKKYQTWDFLKRPELEWNIRLARLKARTQNLNNDNIDKVLLEAEAIKAKDLSNKKKLFESMQSNQKNEMSWEQLQQKFELMLETLEPAEDE